MRHLTAVVVMLMALTVAGKPASAATERPVPQYWLKQNVSICVFRVDTNGATLESYLKFLDGAYKRTDQWRGDFGIAGVDYVRFRKFYILTRKISCSDIIGARKFVAADFPAAGVSSDESGKQYIGALSEWDAGPVKLISRYKPGTPLQSCMISFQTRNGVDPLKFYGEFSRIALLKYRFPIVHVSFANEQFNMPFSDYCGQRGLILGEILTAADRDHVSLRNQMTGVSLITGEKEYRSRFVSP
jgi:hypothetical protein